MYSNDNFDIYDEIDEELEEDVKDQINEELGIKTELNELQCFQLFFSDKIIDALVQESNNYYRKILIEKYGNINYLYITKDLKNKENKDMSTAFINVINYKTIVPLFMNLRNYKFNSNGELYSLKIMYSSAQGKKQLKEYVKQAYFCQYFE